MSLNVFNEFEFEVGYCYFPYICLRIFVMARFQARVEPISQW